MNGGNKKRKLLYLVVAIVAVLCVGIILLSTFTKDKSSEPPEITVVYFYMNACGACNVEEEFSEFFFKELGEDKEDIKIKLVFYNTFKKDGQVKYDEYCKKYKVKDVEYGPFLLFINDSYIAGENNIKKSLKDVFVEEKSRLLKN